MGVDDKAAGLGRKLGLKGTPGYFVGLAIVGFILLVMYFVLKPVAASASNKISAIAAKAKDATKSALGTAAPATSGDPRGEGL